MALFSFDLTLGLPHTNYNQLAEHLLMMHLGHFQWQAIAKSVRCPLSRLRAMDGGEVYATFYYIEERIPEGSPLTSFRLDDTISVRLQLRAFRNFAVDGRIIFDHRARIDGASIQSEAELLTAYSGSEYPSVRFANVFVTPHGGNAALKLAPPANASFEDLPDLPNEENAYNITRSAERARTFGLFDSGWNCLNPIESFAVAYTINPDRDSNGAGLVYFANYFAFLDAAERLCLEQEFARGLPNAPIPPRTLRFRQLAYFGNAELTDTIRTAIHLFQHQTDPSLVGFRYTITRERDQATICLSEAIKSLGVHDHAL